MAGHEPERALLARAHERGTLAKTMLFHGPRGVGKQRMALWLAQLMLCMNPHDSGPCDQCVSCLNASRLEHPDLHWYFPVERPKGAGSPEKLRSMLEQARADGLGERKASPLAYRAADGPTGLYLALIQSLRGAAQKKPVLGDVQVFIVGDAEAMVPQEASPEAANAMLKLLEEPPGGTRFILTSSEPGELLDTIRSRTAGLHLSPLPVDEVGRFLETHAGAGRDEATEAARLSRGSIGQAMGYLGGSGDERGPLAELRRRSYRLLGATLGTDASAEFGAALPFPPARARSLLPLFESLGQWLRDLAAVLSGARDHVPVSSQAALDKVIGDRALSPVAVARCLDHVQDAAYLASANVNPQLIVFSLVRKLRQEILGRKART